MRRGDVIAERFEIGRLAGSGGMGEVYFARDRMTGRPVAVKVLRLRADEDSGTIERFLREARVLSELDHPGIVGYVAHGETIAGDIYLAMEWLEGEDLASRLSRSRLNVPETVELGRRVAEAVGVAHARGIVHRDLKPENIFLQHCRLDRAKVLDFGLARFAENVRALTRTGMTVGTPVYMAPEQALADGHVAAPADVFSLGCVLFQCLTGHVPFGGDRVRAVLLKILHDEPRPLIEVRPDVPPALDALIRRMLEKDADKRPQDANAVVAELEQLHVGAPVSSLSVPPAAITRAERRLTAFVVVGATEPVEDVSLADAATLSVDLRVAAVRRAIESHGALLDIMADGSLVVALTTTGSATDLAAQAARCALSIRARIPEAPVAVTMGRKDAGVGSGVTRAVERAVTLLEDASPGSSMSAVPAVSSHPIRLDEIVAGLLDSRFVVDRDAHGALLARAGEFSRKPRTVLGRQTPFVGRERELDTLRAIFDESRRESVARVVLVTAPAGFGKSRLCFEFLRQLTERAAPVEIWSGRGNPMTAGAPLSLLSTVIRSAAQINETDSLEQRREKLRKRLARHGSSEDVLRIGDFIGEAAATPFPDESSESLRAARHDPPLMAEQMRRAWETLLVAECSAHPVVLALEDLHWGDLPSVKLVDGALRRLRNYPLFVLATARPSVADIFPRLWAERGLTEMRLSALTMRSCERIVRAVRGRDARIEEIADVTGRAEGNPFFLEEFLRAQADRSERAPDTLIAMVQSRIERLDPEARRVLRAASVFGMQFDEAGVRALLGGRISEAETRRWLQMLADEELIELPVDGAVNARRHTFRQALVRDAAYAMFTEEDRKLAHRLAAEWLAGRRTEAYTIAHHLDRAVEPARAIPWYRRAAETALSSDVTAAVGHSERGVELGAKGEELGALRAIEAEALVARGQLERAVKAAEQASENLPRGSERWCKAASTLSGALYLLGDMQRFEALFDDLLRMEPKPEARSCLDAFLASTALLSDFAGSHDRAALCLDRISTSSEEAERDDPLLLGQIELAQAAHAWLCRADPWAQVQHARRAAGAFERVHDLAHAGYADGCVAAALIAMGAYVEAENLLSRRLSAVESAELRLCVAALRPLYGLTLAHLGDMEAARSEARAALTDGATAKSMHLAATARCALANIEFIAGNPRAAEREAEALVGTQPPRVLAQVEALAPLAAARLQLGKVREAMAAGEAAMKWMAASGGMGHSESLVRLAHAQALAATGRHDAARSAFAAAAARLEHRAARIADRKLRSNFLRLVPENARTLGLAAASAASGARRA